MGDYSSGDEASLPGTSANLEHVYDATDRTNVGTDDTDYVNQTATGEYALHQYKDSITATSANVTWKGKSSLAPSSSIVQLQVYKVAVPAGWENVSGAGAFNNVAGADTDFTLSGTVTTADYLDTGVITFRVYQLATPEDIYWPVAGVTKPQHLWPFSQTGDYSDQGSTGGLTLSAAGSGNSFGAGGLILNGSGYATRANNADICDLSGGVFSILLEFTVAANTNYYCGLCAGTRQTDGWTIWATFGEPKILYEVAGANFASINNIITTGTTHQIIITRAADDSFVIYNNGSSNTSDDPITAPTSTAGGFVVGAIQDGSNPFTGTIKRVGVLKGTVWSGADVSSIWAGLP